ncbi:uncharacterized protein K02A2.6-like [Lampris incognitus]|uniref:uncharacterized protein K02A2.6-like n=1 Tax=Lampris incognitus TaxID=2546036 RepID=UPI0024B5D0F2|nr:uncharacterized protein K02A2.6-like [Lampris incognitus]
MAGIIGGMEPFEESGEQWATYIERFENYILANEIRDAKKVPVLLSVIGPKTYGLLRSLIAPDKPGEKKYGDITVRLCGDFKVTLNQALCVDQYPIPRIEDLFASLARGQRFSKLDLSNAYLQMEVVEESRKLLTISTQKGLFCYNRLPFGIASAPALFQKAMDQVLVGLPFTHCYLDDILVSGPDEETHLKALDDVLTRLEEYGLHVKKDKCMFFQESVEYLGHIIDAAGLHKSPEKECALMVSQKVLTHYNPELPLRLACDASPYGVGAVPSHVMPDGVEKPIAYASRTLSKAEQNYAQIEREALGIVFGIRKFHQYLYGNKFTLLTDHRPLTSILSPNDLTIQQGCLMWGTRVVVPPKLRPRVLNELHTAHPGVVRMKSLARSYVWWPGIDSQIKLQAKSCHSCQRSQREPSLAPLHPWMWPSSPWERIHVDFAGSFEGHMYLVVVDAHSKWPEVQIMDSTTASKTITVLRGLFSRHGLPHILISDNGPQFCSEEFATFLKANGVKHLRSAPYHPATNGLAERFVQTFKHALKSSRGAAPVQQRLDTFLLTYRNTPHATTKEPPSMLFTRRMLRTRVVNKPYIKPNNMLQYVHTESNHPASILKNIPESIKRRLSKLRYPLRREKCDNVLKVSRDLFYNRCVRTKQSLKGRHCAPDSVSQNPTTSRCAMRTGRTGAGDSRTLCGYSPFARTLLAGNLLATDRSRLWKN